MTTKLEQRIHEQKTGAHPDSHTAKQGIDQLVYLATFTSMPAAIYREKQLKGWLRIRKLDLIIANNPTRHDLSLEWGTPTSVS